MSDKVVEILERIEKQLTLVLDAVARAETEVPEYMRRFTMYYHDIVHIRNAYVELGLAVPPHIDSEMERAHDRMSHLLDDENNQGGTFYKIRREMEERGSNRYKHVGRLR